MVVVDVVVVVCVVVDARVVEVVVVVSMGRVVVDEEDVKVVVVVCGRVVVVIVDVVVVVVDVVVVGEVVVVNASSGTIVQSPSSIFHASIRQVPPPFSYINNSKGTLETSSSSSPDIVAEQPWSFQTPKVLPSIVISPPSSDANQNSIVLCSGIVM